jgi:hypothetical protein
VRSPVANPGARVGLGVALLACLALLVPLYAANPSLGFAWETTSAGLAARSLARSGDLSVREFFPLADPGRQIGYALRWRGEDLHSIEPLASILTFVPFFALHPPTAPPIREPDPLHARVAAEVTVLMLAILGFWLAAVAGPARAVLVVLVIALATSIRTIQGAGLWQHTSAALWLVIGLFAWSRAEARPRLYLVAAAALALATACRPIFVVAPLLLAFDAWRSSASGRSREPGPVIGTLALIVGIGGLALAANFWLHGSFLGGRVEFVESPERYADVRSYFAFSPLHWAGLLVSPNRGLFVFSPVLLFALPGLLRTLRGDAPSAQRLITLAGLATFFLYGFIRTWWAGSVYGPRYTADLLPFFAFWLALTPLPTRARPVWATLFAVAFLFSAAVQSVGARAYPCGWNAFPALIDDAPERVWSLRDSQIRRCLGRAIKLAERA